MGLKTRSKFYYGLEITVGQTFIDFDDGLPETVELSPRSYSISRIGQILAQAMNSVSGLGFSVSIDRQTRLCTISANSNFSLLLNSGPNAANSALRALGFNQVTDLTGASSYTGTDPVGLVYTPQFYLINYLPPEAIREAVEATINETGSGRAEIVKYGSRNFVQLEIDFVTNQVMPQGSIIEDDRTAFEKLVDFMVWITDKKEVELMVDRDDVSQFNVLQLESTSTSALGTGYELREKAQYQGFYQTGALKFRLL